MALNGLAFVGYFAMVGLIFLIGQTLTENSIASTQLALCLAAIGLTLAAGRFLARQPTRSVACAIDDRRARALAFAPEHKKAVVYVFRNSMAHRRKPYDLHLNRRPWTSLKNDTFSVIAVDPGLHTISSICPADGSRADCMMALYEDRVYFFEQYFSLGWGESRHGIRLLPPETGRRRIVNCFLLNN